eukprot:UN13350
MSYTTYLVSIEYLNFCSSYRRQGLQFLKTKEKFKVRK